MPMVLGPNDFTLIAGVDSSTIAWPDRPNSLNGVLTEGFGCLKVLADVVGSLGVCPSASLLALESDITLGCVPLVLGRGAKPLSTVLESLVVSGVPSCEGDVFPVGN